LGRLADFPEKKLTGRNRPSPDSRVSLAQQKEGRTTSLILSQNRVYSSLYCLSSIRLLYRILEKSCIVVHLTVYQRSKEERKIVDLKLTNKLALVTGSTAGIGRAIVEALAREGARVIVNGRAQAAVDAAIAGASIPMSKS
jgi:hypothetical protein